MKTTFYFALLLFICLTFSSCDALLDCIASASPQLSTKALATGGVSFSYDDFIEGSVKNDSHDDAYSYSFTIDGTIPSGLNYIVDGRKIRFLGTPTKAGNYKITVHLKIDVPNDYDTDENFADNDRICLGNDSTSNEYTFIIN